MLKHYSIYLKSSKITSETLLRVIKGYNKVRSNLNILTQTLKKELKIIFSDVPK